MKTKNIGCLGWLSISGYCLAGFGVLSYLFSDANEVFGYLDWSFVIFGIVLPIVIIGKLYELKRIINFFKLFYKIIFVFSLLYVIVIVSKVVKDGFGDLEKILFHLMSSSITLVISGLIYFYFDTRPRIRIRNEKVNKKIALEKLIQEGKNNVAINNENFKKKLEELHGDRFDYEKVVLERFEGIDPNNNNIKIIQTPSVTLLCKKHDTIFNESVSEVFKTIGCERCKIEDNYNSAKREKEDGSYMSSQESFSLFRDRLNEIFNDKYDFSKVNYSGMKNKVSVICPNHGTFVTLPSKLLKGAGCPICSRERRLKETKSNDLKIKKGIIQSNTEKEVNNEVNVSAEEHDVLINLLNQMSLDINEIKKDGKKTKETVIKIDKNIDILVQIESIKGNCEKNNEDDCIEKIIALIEKDFDFKNSKQFEKNVKAWFDFWDRLESLSQDFMSQSEFLYFSIESSDFKDYSPFVLYSCRALEHELLQKVFIAYHNYIDRKYPNKNSLFEYDPDQLNSATIKDIESGQMSHFKRKFNNPKYTLGDMRLILNLLPNKKDTKGSKRYQALLALQELNSFINDKVGEIPSQLIKTIEKIISNYRNPSAHVGVLDKKKADSFKKDYKKLMNDLLGLFN